MRITAYGQTCRGKRFSLTLFKLQKTFMLSIPSCLPIMFVVLSLWPQLVAENALGNTELLQGVRDALWCIQIFCRLNNTMTAVKMYSVQMYVFVIDK